MRLELFNIGNFKIDGGAMFGVIPKALWSRAYPPDENNLLNLSLRSMIIETGGRIILVDTGWGEKQDEKFFRHVHKSGGEGLIEGLNNRGYTPEDITDVFFTHLHADHCGGAIKTENGQFKLTFPNAKYHVSRTQWEWALKSNPREEDSYPEENFLPMDQDGHLNLVETEHEMFPGFSLMMCYGHTPGLMVPIIKYNTTTFVYAGDLIPTSAHIPLIWNMSYDIESLKTIDEKHRLLKKSLEENYIIVFQHDINVECCSLDITERGIRIKEKFRFSDVI